MSLSNPSWREWECCKTDEWWITDLGLALRPGAVFPAVAGLHQTGLPLLHLGRTWPPIALGNLDHCPPPPQLACKKADKRKKNNLFMRTWTGTLIFDPFTDQDFGLCWDQEDVRVRAAGRTWMWKRLGILLLVDKVTFQAFHHWRYSGDLVLLWEQVRINEGY